MKLNTTRFGTIEIDENLLIQFDEGLPGFEQLTRWCLLHLEQSEELNWLQSVEDPDVALLLADPDRMFQNYEVELDRNSLAPLALSEASEEGPTHPIVMRVVVRLDAEGVVANLRAPILFNMENNQAMQVVLPIGTYSTAERLRPTFATTEEIAEVASSDANTRLQQQTVV